MHLLALVVLALPVAQDAPAALKPGSIKRLIRSLETGTEQRAEEAAQELLGAGTQVLPYLPDSLVRLEERWQKDEVSLESAERVRALRMMIAAANQDALEPLLEQAGDPRDPVRTRSQHALAVLPENPAPELIRRWRDLSPAQRENSIMALVISGTPEARDQLVAVLGEAFEDSSNARLRAAMGLRAFAPAEASVAALEAVVAGDDSNVAAGACSTLWSYGEGGIDGLVAAQSSGFPGVVNLASGLLADLGAPAKDAVLKALAKSPQHLHLLRVARVIAPEDSITQRTFLELRRAGSELQSELVLALPELLVDGGLRIEILTEFLTHSSDDLALEALLASLRLPDPEFAALRAPLKQAWLRPDATEDHLGAAATAILRMELHPEALLDWCQERMGAKGDSGRITASVLAGTLADGEQDLLIEHIRQAPSADREHWLPALIGQGGAAEELLVELVDSTKGKARPMMLGFLAMAGSEDKAVLDILRGALKDPSSPSFGAVLNGLAKFGAPSKGLLDPVLKGFDELSPKGQSLALRAAARCDPESKRLFSVAKKALTESPMDAVRASAAAALGVGRSSIASRTKTLKASLERDGQAKKDKRKGGGLDLAQLREMQTLLEGEGPATVAAVAAAMAKLDARDSASIEALGASLGGRRLQAAMVAETLRQLSPASASTGERLADLLWRRDLLVRTAALQALTEIEGAAVHADTSLASVVLLQAPEHSEMALDAIESLTLAERPFSEPFLRCASARNTWPLTGIGWTRQELDEPWAQDFPVQGALVPDLRALRRFAEVRRRAADLLGR